jgi:hypothetical protein
MLARSSWSFTEKEGWRALGYNGWRECVFAEFQYQENYLYKLLSAAKVEKNLCTMVQTAEPIPERVLRPLTNLEPDQQCEVWKAVTAITPKPTGKEVSEAVVKMFGEPKPKPKVEPEPIPTDICEVGWLLPSEVRDMAALALTPKNEDWEKSALEFFRSMRALKIIRA